MMQGPHNMPIKLTARGVTGLACARPAPPRSAAYRRRWAYMQSVAIVLGLSFLGSARAMAIAPGDVLKLIEDHGAHAADAKLSGTKEWDEMIAGVASGESEWLTVAEKLLPGTDAGSTSELFDAVAWALPKAPVNVLALVSRKRTDWEVVCSGPPVDFPPPGDSDSYFKRATDAVAGITNKELQGVRAECLTRLATAAKRAKP
jgi:hypothetical protein